MKEFIKKYIYIIIPVILVIFNLSCFIERLEENILNLGIIVFSILVLTLFLHKSNKRTENISSDKTRKIIEKVLFISFPFIELLLLYTYNFSHFFLINYLILLSIQSVIFLVVGNIKITLVLKIILSFIFVSINEILMIIRGTPLIPIDFLSAKVGLELSGNYSFFVSSDLLKFLIVTYVIVIILLKFYNLKYKKKIFFNTVSILSVLAMVCVVFLYFPMLYIDSVFNTNLLIVNNGIPLIFCLNLRDLSLAVPENYNATYAEEILDSYKTSENEEVKEMPNIIVVMSESFTDYNFIQELNTNINPYEFFYSLKEDTIRGNLLVNVEGSGTSTTEFEFLTGMSNALFPAGTNVYMQYLKGPMNSLVSDLKELNYKTYAIHPYWEYSWRRNEVYDYLGFDDFISAEDFMKFKNEKNTYDLTPDNSTKDTWAGLDTVRNYISDKENFKKVIETYEKESGNCFIFNITMQNHGSYLYEGEDFKTLVEIEGNTNKELEQYMSLIKISDDALKEFISYFEENNDRKTIILFFGDHTPFFVETSMIMEDEKKVENFTVPFFIWANYDIEEKEIGTISTNYLSLLLKDCANIPLNSWDLFRKECMHKYPAFNHYFTNTTDRGLSKGFYLHENELFIKYQLLQYYFLKE